MPRVNKNKSMGYLDQVNNQKSRSQKESICIKKDAIPEEDVNDQSNEKVKWYLSSDANAIISQDPTETRLSHQKWKGNLTCGVLKSNWPCSLPKVKIDMRCEREANSLFITFHVNYQASTYLYINTTILTGINYYLLSPYIHISKS